MSSRRHARRWFEGPADQRIAAASSLPGRKRATLRALISICSPVCGLRPTRALRLDTVKVPKPTRATRSPFFSALVTPATTESRALPQAGLLIFARLSLLSIGPALFIRDFLSE